MQGNPSKSQKLPQNGQISLFTNFFRTWEVKFSVYLGTSIIPRFRDAGLSSIIISRSMGEVRVLKKTLRYISKLLYVISRAVRLIILLFVYITTRKRFVIFTCRYFKLSWNTTVLSQSNCRNFSCSSRIIIIIIILKTGVPKKQIAVLLFSWSILHEKAGSSTDCSYFSGS